MTKARKKTWSTEAKGKPPRNGENRYVISLEDARAYHDKIVAVAGFPTLGGYAKVIAQADDLKELKRDLRILGVLERSEDARDTVTVHIYPESAVYCYVSISKKKTQIIRRRKGGAVS
jgi:hypothetical protein